VLRRRPLLIIEDSDDDYEILQTSLESAGVPNELIRCSTGPEIRDYLDAVLKVVTSRRPALIFLDLNLPGADGRAVLRALREHPVLKVVPVIVLTTSSRPADIDVCYRTGASGYLVKPVDLDKFASMVRQVTDYWFDCVSLPENSQAVFDLTA
jgi:CheY-like chemotaxis protein